MSHLDPEHPLYSADLNCPRCGTPHHVPQVQGERCPLCKLEYKLFRPEEGDLAKEFFDAIVREKYLIEIPAGGFAVVHE